MYKKKIEILRIQNIVNIFSYVVFSVFLDGYSRRYDTIMYRFELKIITPNHVVDSPSTCVLLNEVHM